MDMALCVLVENDVMKDNTEKKTADAHNGGRIGAGGDTPDVPIEEQGRA